MIKLSLTAKRMLLGLFTIVMLLLWVNDDYKLGYLGQYGDIAFSAALLIMVFLTFNVIPKINREVAAAKEQKERDLRKNHNDLSDGITLSRKFGTFSKWIVPFLVFAFMVVISFYNFYDSSVSGAISAIVISVIFGGVFFNLMRRNLWNTVDEVIDLGGELFVRVRRKSERIPITDISGIDESEERSGPIVTFDLVKPSLFGRKIRFYAKITLKMENAKPGSICERIVQLRLSRKGM